MMFQKRDDIDRMRIASPCPMDWDKMKGDNRARFCDICSLHVYNIAEMTGSEVKSLIAETEGRICGRLYRRADGTVITKDCPVGLRAIRRRISRVAGATLTAVLSVCMSAVGKPTSHDSRSGRKSLNVSGSYSGPQSQYNRAEISGRVLDQNGEVIQNAKVTIVNQNTGMKATAVTSDNGTFRFTMLPAGIYTIVIESPYFSTFERTGIELRASDILNEDIVLFVEGTMGVIVIEGPDMTYKGSASKTVFTERQIRSLPY